MRKLTERESELWLRCARSFCMKPPLITKSAIGVFFAFCGREGAVCNSFKCVLNTPTLTCTEGNRTRFGAQPPPGRHFRCHAKMVYFLGYCSRLCSGARCRRRSILVSVASPFNSASHALGGVRIECVVGAQEVLELECHFLHWGFLRLLWRRGRGVQFFQVCTEHTYSSVY